MFCKVMSGIVYGVTGLLIHVEVEMQNGLPYFTMVGHLSRESKEAKERVISALRSIDTPLPAQRVTINLSPANLKKSGTAFDFPIGVALLHCMGLIDSEINLSEYCVLGELGLDGMIHSTMQSLPIILEAKKQGITKFLVSSEDYQRLKDVEGVMIYPMESLQHVLSFFHSKKVIIPKITQQQIVKQEVGKLLDFSDVRGQSFLKRALEVAVTGRLNLLIIGSPGTGKTMLCHRLPSILPPLSKEEQLEVDSIYLASSIYRNNNLYIPPFRMPHHTITQTALIGGGAIPKAGEITLAHHGILYLDELGEFKTNCIEALRVPLEDKSITLTRLGRNYQFPADIQLIASMNPCPCGEGFSSDKCRCTPTEKRTYYRKISGPFLDRFDMVLPVITNDYDTKKGESSSIIKKRVCKNRNNFNESINEVTISKNAMELLEGQLKNCHISMRGYERIRKVAKTICIMDGEDKVKAAHMIEAMSYRNLDFLNEVILYD